MPCCRHCGRPAQHDLIQLCLDCGSIPDLVTQYPPLCERVHLGWRERYQRLPEYVRRGQDEEWIRRELPICDER